VGADQARAGLSADSAGWFGIGSKDERDLERAAGEKLGRQETENANAQVRNP
jgi:hypothetical protein